MKSCFSDEDFEKTKQNGLTICRHNENTSICLNGEPILTVYDEYYKQDVHKNGQPPYGQLWEERKIYKT